MAFKYTVLQNTFNFTNYYFDTNNYNIYFFFQLSFLSEVKTAKLEKKYNIVAIYGAYSAVVFCIAYATKTL